MMHYFMTGGGLIMAIILYALFKAVEIAKGQN